MASALDWWATAGVDTYVGETPRQWLRERPAAANDSPAAEVELAPTAIPAEPDGPLACAGDPAAGLMLLIDMPEAEDADCGRLLSGAAGSLLDRMLGAIGREREAVFIACVAQTRTATGRLDPAALATLAERARQRVAAAAPRIVLALGDISCRVLLGETVAAARGRIHAIEIGGTPVRVIASFHPRTLLQHPAAKAEAWRDLQMLVGAMS